MRLATYMLVAIVLMASSAATSWAQGDSNSAESQGVGDQPLQGDILADFSPQDGKKYDLKVVSINSITASKNARMEFLVDGRPLVAGQTITVPREFSVRGGVLGSAREAYRKLRRRQAAGNRTSNFQIYKLTPSEFSYGTRDNIATYRLDLEEFNWGESKALLRTTRIQKDDGNGKVSIQLQQQKFRIERLTLQLTGWTDWEVALKSPNREERNEEINNSCTAELVLEIKPQPELRGSASSIGGGF